MANTEDDTITVTSKPVVFANENPIEFEKFEMLFYYEFRDTNLARFM